MRCYVLFAGSQRTPRGGLADLVGIFPSEATARQAFWSLSVNRTSATSWAQLAVVDGELGIQALSWFGIGATPARTHVTFARPEKLIHTQTEGGVIRVATSESWSPAGPEIEPIARRHPLKRITVWLVGLVAVVAITIGVVSDDERTRPVTWEPATVDGSRPADGPVAPFSVDGSLVTDGTSSVGG